MCTRSGLQLSESKDRARKVWKTHLVCECKQQRPGLDGRGSLTSTKCGGARKRLPCLQASCCALLMACCAVWV